MPIPIPDATSACTRRASSARWTIRGVKPAARQARSSGGELGAGQARDPAGVAERLESERLTAGVVMREHEQERLAHQRMRLQPTGGRGLDSLVGL